jgi:hypothetical protein
MPNYQAVMNTSCHTKKLLFAIAIAASLAGCGGGGAPNPQPQNQAPTASAGADQSVDKNASVTLSGSGTDSDGSISSYTWSQTSGTSVALNNSNNPSTSFTAPDISAQEVLEFELTVTDDDGATNTDSVSITVQPIVAQLSNLPLMFSDSPTQNQEITVSLMTDEDVGEVDWEVISQPSLANLSLNESVGNKSATFTATEAGEYEIVARSVSDGSEKASSFSISPVFSFDESKIEGNDGSVDIETITGEITNQSWINSSNLSRIELEIIVAEFSGLNIVGYDDTLGLLVEYDETDISIQESLEKIKTRPGVDSVRNRVYEGDDSFGLSLAPDDGSAFDNDGDNWHLEFIGATEAWEYTTGNEDVVVGVSEGAFDTTHDELLGRFSNVVSNDDKSDSTKAHGNASAGSIGAVTDNETGMSGVNWDSQMSLGSWSLNGLKNILSDDDVVAINSSWGFHLPDTFDPDNAESANTRRTDSINRFQKYRDLSNDNPNVLLVWAAGNGIGNGLGNSNDVYGTNAIFDNGAIHYNEDEQLSRRENVIVVAAMKNDSRLTFYSNYGKSVDIASPTAYKSLSIDDEYKENSFGKPYGEDGGYIGTSAAAPVVTGVASLVYSLYPGFTGKDVKDILIDSATASVSERYTEPEGLIPGADTEALNDGIPILNAAKALEKAQEIIDGKVTVTDSIPDPFTAQAQIKISSIDEELEVTSIDWKLQSTNDGGATWNFVGGMSVNGDVAEPFLDTSTSNQRIVATITLRNPDNGNETTANKEYEFSYSTVDISAVDTVSLASLSTVEVSLELLSGLPITSTGFSDGNGIVQAYLKPGDYKVRGNLNEYQEAVTSITVSGMQSQQVSLNMTPDSIGAVGSLSGQVVDSNGEAFVGSSVRISGGTQTNGFFASATTDANGNYVISNISKTDSSGSAIPAFILEASAFGYATIVKEDVIVLAGKERVENFTLTSVDLSENTVFSDDFEQGLGSWSATGFWSQINLSVNTIPNTLVDGGYTSLAPDEAGPQALLPNAFNGNSAWWYGQLSTGSFIGTQSSSDGILSGGTSTISNSGQLTSPSINLVSTTTPFLRFRTWWEVESVNPNQSGFDIMEVQVSTDGGSSFTTIKKLNPFVDPNDSDRDAKPFSSGGFNRKPVWVLEEIDLSNYVGEVITLRFDFKTKDTQYNGFRGWIIDILEIVDFSSSASAVAAKSMQFKSLQVQTKNARNEFLEVHKKPKTYSFEGIPTR